LNGKAFFMWKCPKCGGIIAKAMCEVPEKVKKAVMYIPSGTNNPSHENRM